MQYRSVTEALFLARPNRFLARVERDGREETVHVKNTGRCRELLVPGCRVYLAQADNPTRKTAYDLVAAVKGDLLINLDSQAPNQATREFLMETMPGWEIRSEVTSGASRFDFCARQGGRVRYIEVKGVTLEEDRFARFPDAPTARGTKHLRELIALAQQGIEAEILFVVQFQGAKSVSPNRATDPAFAQALMEAKQSGVCVRAMECEVTPSSIRMIQEIPVDVLV